MTPPKGHTRFKPCMPCCTSFSHSCEDSQRTETVCARPHSNGSQYQREGADAVAGPHAIPVLWCTAGTYNGHWGPVITHSSFGYMYYCAGPPQSAQWPAYHYESTAVVHFSLHRGADLALAFGAIEGLRTCHQPLRCWSLLDTQGHTRQEFCPLTRLLRTLYPKTQGADHRRRASVWAIEQLSSKHRFSDAAVAGIKYSRRPGAIEKRIMFTASALSSPFGNNGHRDNSSHAEPISIEASKIEVRCSSSSPLLLSRTHTGCGYVSQYCRTYGAVARRRAMFEVSHARTAVFMCAVCNGVCECDPHTAVRSNE